MEKYKLHWNFFLLANKSLLQLYVFCLSTKEKEEKFAWKQMKVNDLYEKHIRHLVLNARDLPRHLAFGLAFEPEVV